MWNMSLFPSSSAGIAAMLLAACCPNSGERKAPGEAKVLLRLDTHSWSSCQSQILGARQQPGPALIRGLHRADFSMRVRMPTVSSPSEETICSPSNSIFRTRKRPPKVLYPARPMLERIYAETTSSFSCLLVLWCDYGSNAFIRLGKEEKSVLKKIPVFMIQEDFTVLLEQRGSSATN